MDNKIAAALAEDRLSNEEYEALAVEVKSAGVHVFGAHEIQRIDAIISALDAFRLNRVTGKQQGFNADKSDRPVYFAHDPDGFGMHANSCCCAECQKAPYVNVTHEYQCGIHFVTGDDGNTAVARGDPGSSERLLQERPRLIAELHAMKKARASMTAIMERAKGDGVTGKPELLNLMRVIMCL